MLDTCTSVSIETNEKFLRHTRNVWSLVDDKMPKRYHNITDTSQFVENVLNDSSIRFRDKLKSIKKRIECGVENHLRYANFSQAGKFTESK